MHIVPTTCKTQNETNEKLKYILKYQNDDIDMLKRDKKLSIGKTYGQKKDEGLSAMIVNFQKTKSNKHVLIKDQAHIANCHQSKK